MNTANKITMVRVVLIPVFLVVLYLDFPYHIWVGLAVFLIASLSDFLDGYIARSRNMITDFGKFMDPIADKMLVTSAMCMFVAWGRMEAWMLLVVLTREFAVSAMRLVAASEGKVIAAAWSGKVKTASTMVCIILMLAVSIPVLDTICCWVIVVTTVYSGVEYFVKNKDVINWADM
ncbi:MAG: CDP-diacylglycerol--glycerol-3-phosphate 3-phosphatidyltransferase [Clostridiales bacterium]|nr:CDP-diacylglycerol--glycerol-3-phosphate 3-phosphatidyltransferase [Clostridiales bacterium]MCD7844012.1 CDP-diacylglycerol--glycerol-3-phosphate 3-phosphatidyltransferase [Clostridiales bacterium]